MTYRLAAAEKENEGSTYFREHLTSPISINYQFTERKATQNQRNFRLFFE